MSHLDTAYQLGVKKAEEDFNIELQKAAQPFRPGSSVPPAPTSVPVGSPAEAVRGSAASGLATSSRQAMQGAKMPTGAPPPQPAPVVPPKAVAAR